MKNIQFENDISKIAQNYPKLEVKSLDGEKFVSGEIDIIDLAGKTWETYSISIKASRHYPKMFPTMFETGDAFPKIADWHVNLDGSCCIDVPESEMIICKDGLDVNEFIERHAIPYLANQKFRELEGYYLYGEYSHGIFGKIEFYQSKLKARTPLEMLQMFEFIIKGTKLGRTAFCPFCHKKKFRNCHKDAFEELSSIKPFIYFDGKEQLAPFFIQNPNYILPSI